jgi:hypothetical protein
MVRASSSTNVTLFITDNSVLLVILGALPRPSHRCRGVEWSRYALKIDASAANLQAPDGDDAEGEGASSVEPITPGPIGSHASVQINPPVADQAGLGAPSAGGHKWKHPPAVPKRKQTKTSTVQVMTQIELPPYGGPKVL